MIARLTLPITTNFTMDVEGQYAAKKGENATYANLTSSRQAPWVAENYVRTNKHRNRIERWGF